MPPLLPTSTLLIGPAEMLGASLATLVTLLLVVFFRRRLPAGVPEGVFMAALSGLLIANHALGRNIDASDQEWPLAIALTGLAFLWFFAARWVERDVRGGSPGRSPQPLRRVLGEQAAVVAGLAAAVVLLGQRNGGRGGTAAVVTALVLAVPAFFVDAAGRPWTPYLAGGALLVAVGCGLTEETRAAWARPAADLALYGGLGAFLLALTAVWQRWRARCAVWLAEPERLAQERPADGRAAAMVVALSGASALAAGLAGPVGLVPFGLAAAALGTLTAGHRRASVVVGEFGLLLTGLVVVYGAGRWLPGGSANVALGVALAALWMLWLARFWQQQLHEGRSWTTAGRLIPSARRLSAVFAAGAGVSAGLWASGGAVGEPWPLVVLAALALLGLGLLSLRDAREYDSPAGCLAGLLGLTASGVPVADLVRAGGVELPVGVWLALVALLVALRTPAGRDERLVAGTRSAWVGGVLPVAAVYSLAWVPDSRQLAVLAIVAVALLAAWGLRWRAERRSVPAGVSGVEQC